MRVLPLHPGVQLVCPFAEHPCHSLSQAVISQDRLSHTFGLLAAIPQAAPRQAGIGRAQNRSRSWLLLARASSVREISPLFPCLVSVCSLASCPGIPGSKDLVWWDWTWQRLPESSLSFLCCVKFWKENAALGLCGESFWTLVKQKIFWLGHGLLFWGDESLFHPFLPPASEEKHQINCLRWARPFRREKPLLMAEVWADPWAQLGWWACLGICRLSALSAGCWCLFIIPRFLLLVWWVLFLCVERKVCAACSPMSQESAGGLTDQSPLLRHFHFQFCLNSLPQELFTFELQQMGSSIQKVLERSRVSGNLPSVCTHVCSSS